MVEHRALADAQAAYGEPLLVPRTALLFDLGEPCTGAYVIKTGTVDVRLISPEGIAIWSRALSAGGILGLPAAISLRQHHVRAIATAESHMVFLTADKVRTLIQTEPHIGLMIIEAISEELNALRSRLPTMNG